MIPSFLLRLLMGRGQEEDGENDPFSPQTGPRNETNESLLRDLQEQPDALQTYRQHVERTPQEADYRPRVPARILAGISDAFASFGGNTVTGDATESLRAPYERALLEHKTRGEGLRQGAELELKDERNAIAQSRVANQLAAETMRHNAKLAEIDVRRKQGESEVKLKAEEIAERIRHNQAAEAINRMNAESNRTRAGAYASSSARQAGAAEVRAQADQTRADAYSKYGGITSEDRPIAPQSQEKAEELAARDMMKKAEFAPWVKVVDGERIIARSEMPPDVQKKFDDALEARIKERLTMTTRGLRR